METKDKATKGKITIDREQLEHILNCLRVNEFIVDDKAESKGVSEDSIYIGRKIVHKAWRDGMDLLNNTN